MCMPSTSVHFPRGVLEEIERRAAETGLSRNRFIVDSCRKTIEEGRPAWPQDFFSDRHLSRSALKELHSSAAAFEQALRDARRNRQTAPF